ncbi:MAG: hypothetical protein KBC84_04290 [Proteobacteria bacterium]|nr:hypothetical protein [Pseudomonadota bacterium]
MEEDNSKSYQTTLVTLSLIILSFFAYLNTLTVPHPLKEKKALQSITTELSASSQIAKLSKEYKYIKLTNELKSLGERYQANLNISDNYFNMTIPTTAMFENDTFTADGEKIFDKLANIAEEKNLSIKVTLQYFSEKDLYQENIEKAFNLTAKLNRRLIFHGIKPDNINCLAALTSWKPLLRIEIC